MSAGKHTPGPWWVTDHGVRDVGGYIAHTNSVQRYEGQDERYALEVAQREADKRLIAAAPDLLEALQNLENDDNSIPAHAWALVQAAINKATGDTK